MVLSCRLGLNHDNYKLGIVTDKLVGITVIHRGLSRLEKWAQGNLTKVSQGKCKVLQLCRRTLGGNGGQQVEDESAMRPGGTEGQQLARLHQQKSRQQVKESDNFFLFQQF